MFVKLRVNSTNSMTRTLCDEGNYMSLPLIMTLYDGASGRDEYLSCTEV